MYLLLGLLLWAMPTAAQGVRWHLSGDGGIDWDVGADDAHTDHIEMAGKGIAAIVTYGATSSGRLVLRQHLVFPGLRKMPNDTRGSYALDFSDNIADSILVNGQPIVEKPISFHIRGVLRITSQTQTPLVVQRTVFPSVDKRAYLEAYTITNSGTDDLTITHADDERRQRDGRAEGGGRSICHRSKGLQRRGRSAAPRQQPFLLLCDFRPQTV